MPKQIEIPKEEVMEKIKSAQKSQLDEGNGYLTMMKSREVMEHSPETYSKIVGADSWHQALKKSGALDVYLKEKEDEIRDNLGHINSDTLHEVLGVGKVNVVDVIEYINNNSDDFTITKRNRSGREQTYFIHAKSEDDVWRQILKGKHKDFDPKYYPVIKEVVSQGHRPSSVCGTLDWLLNPGSQSESADEYGCTTVSIRLNKNRVAETLIEHGLQHEIYGDKFKFLDIEGSDE